MGRGNSVCLFFDRGDFTLKNEMLYGCLPEISSNGDFYTSTDIETIIQSIWVILTTSKEDRPWAPEFGCNIFQYV